MKECCAQWKVAVGSSRKHKQDRNAVEVIESKSQLGRWQRNEVWQQERRLLWEIRLCSPKSISFEATSIPARASSHQMLNSKYYVLTVGESRWFLRSHWRKSVWLSLLKKCSSLRGINTGNTFNHFTIPSSKVNGVLRHLAQRPKKVRTQRENKKVKYYIKQIMI